MAAPKGFQPKIVGDRSCAAVLARLLHVYDTVLLPFGENQRYDLVIDTGSEFLRVQCKTGRLRRGVITFKACSLTYHHASNGTQHGAQDYRGSADFVGVYCPDNDCAYLVPVDEIGRKQGSLRVGVTRNGQSSKIRWAQHYEIRQPAGDG